MNKMKEKILEKLSAHLQKGRGLARTPAKAGVSLQRGRGFSLIETLVYAFVLGVVIMVVMAFILSMLTTIRNFQIARNINQAALVSVERIIQEARLSDSIDTDLSVFSDDLSDAYLLGTEEEVSVTKRFFVEDGELKLSKTPGNTISLTPVNITVEKFLVENLVAPNSSGLKVEIELYDERKPANIKSFYNSVILRGSYASE